MPSSSRSAFHAASLSRDVEHHVRDVRAGARDASTAGAGLPVIHATTMPARAEQVHADAVERGECLRLVAEVVDVDLAVGQHAVDVAGEKAHARARGPALRCGMLDDSRLERDRAGAARRRAAAAVVDDEQLRDLGRRLHRSPRNRRRAASARTVRGVRVITSRDRHRRDVADARRGSGAGRRR